jgi:hypothetical protein
MVFIFWRGWGILTILIVAVTAIVVGALLHALLTAAGRPDLAYLAVSLGLFAATAANWFIGRRMNSSEPRELIDTRTNQRVILHRLHTLFWIRMEYWSIPVAICAFIPLLALFGHR